MQTSSIVRLIIWAFGSAILVHTLLKKLTRSKTKNYNEESDHWILDGIYYNQNDKRIFLQSRIGGITLNFARLTSWIILAMIVALIIYTTCSSK